MPLEWLLTYELLIALSSAASPQGKPSSKPAKFSLSSFLDAVVLPAIQPFIAADSSKCEAFKTFFGLNYEQMLEKNGTNLSMLSIDLITNKGNVKFNLTSTDQLLKAMKRSNRIIILVHGFMESSDGLMVQGLAPALLQQPGLQVFALDGRKVINLEYFRSSTHTLLIGEKFGDLLGELINQGQEPSSVTLIGHSLGAHIVGIAGKRVQQLTKQSVGGIIGLDPAGPCFANAEFSRRLQSTDAVQVQVIHTNAGVLGLKEPAGNKDFYPNGGMSQPGCYFSTCDHSRAWELLAEAILAPDHFPARKCSSWAAFRDGMCSKNEVSYMGMSSTTSSPGLYFLSTRSASPFGLGAAGSG